MFFLNISIIIVDINAVQKTLCSEISPLFFDLFFKIFCQKKKSMCLSMLKMFSLKTVSGFQSCAKGQSREINDHHVGIKIILIIKIQFGPF